MSGFWKWESTTSIGWLNGHGNIFTTVETQLWATGIGRETCKKRTANIGLCSFAIGPTFHRHIWSHRVIHWEWQIHEWSVFAVLILQFFGIGPVYSRRPIHSFRFLHLLFSLLSSGRIFSFCGRTNKVPFRRTSRC